MRCATRLPGALIGASAHSAAEAAALLRAGADYVTISPVFLTASKPGYGPAMGLDGLARIVAGSTGPGMALGGITPENAALCRAAGALVSRSWARSCAPPTRRRRSAFVRALSVALRS